ncbi:MAG TPA: flagellar assembly protein FliH [Povalibacter sp.]
MNARTQPAVTDTVSVWDLPAVSGRPMQGRRPGPTVGELEEIEKKAYEEAYAAGREAALAATRAEMQPVIERLRAQVSSMAAVVDKLARPLDELDEQVTEQLTKLAMVIAKQVIRRELRTDPAQIIGVMRETVALLPASAREVCIYLHPEDAAVIREHMAAPGGNRAWSLAEDPLLTRGGCRVATQTSQIDVRVETRIATVAAAMFGEERSADRTEGSTE